jgi:hypothetical protein
MADEKKIVTGLGKPELHRVLIRGYDLTKDLVGKITFSDMTYLMLVGRFPNDGERRMTDALLTILVEHGMVSSVVSARLCYSTAPEAMRWNSTPKKTNGYPGLAIGLIRTEIHARCVCSRSRERPACMDAIAISFSGSAKRQRQSMEGHCPRMSPGRLARLRSTWDCRGS